MSYSKSTIDITIRIKFEVFEMKLSLRPSLLAILLTALPCSLSASALYKELENWSIHVDESLNNGCFAIAYYNEGTIFRLGFDNTSENGADLYFILGNENWSSLEEGKKYDISIQFGKKEKWNGRSLGFKFDDTDKEVYLQQYIASEGDASVEFFREFMQEKSVRFFYQNKQIDIVTLRGSYAAGLELIECQKLMNTTTDTDKDPFTTDPDQKKSSDPFI